MGNSRKPSIRAILVVTLVCIVLFSASYTQFGKSASSSISINDEAVYATSTSVSLTLSFDGLFQPQMCFSNDDVSWTDWESFAPSKAWTLTAGDGEKTVYVQFQSLFESPIKDSDTILLDATAPSLTISSPASGLWFKSSSVEVSGSALDSGSGLSKVEYRIGASGAWSLAIGTATWSFNSGSLAEGSHTIYVRATDVAGNTMTPVYVEVKVDTVAPSSSVYPLLNPYQSSSSFAVSYTSQDTTSGINNVHLWVKTPRSSSYADLGAWISGGTYTANEGDGLYQFSTSATDNAGNTETAPIAADASTKVDSLPPTTTASPSGTPLAGETGWYTGTVRVTLSAVDAGSGVSQTYYKLDGAANYQVYAPFNITAKGSTVIYYYSTDNGGYSETPKTTTVNIAYPVTFTASGLPAGTSWSVTLDGTPKSSTGSTITFEVKTGTHTWSVINPLSGGTGIQYVTSTRQGTIDPSLQTAVDVSYVKQYQLTVSSAYGSPTGAGWYDSGSTANFAVSSPALGGTGIRYKFTMWTGDSSSTSPSGSIIMDSAKAITANWQTQYQVTFNVLPLGGGTTSPAATTWVNAGSSINIAATAGSNYLFKSWTNTAGTTSNSVSESTTATVTGSGIITANFELKPVADPTATPTPTPTPTPSPTPTGTADPTSNPTTSPTQGSNTTPRPTAKPSTTSATATPLPTATKPPANYVTRSVLASGSSGSTYITLYGNINGSDISNAVLSSEQGSSKTTLSLTFLGQSGSNSFCNLTVPKRAITAGTVPTVYINNQVVDSQGYTQDDGDYYVWYNTPRNTYDLAVVFGGAFEFPLWIILPIIMVVIVFTAVIVKPKFGSRGSPLLMSRNSYNITDYEISNGVLKFYNSKGLVDKNQAPVREIPISKISSIERFWNEMSVTWNDIIDTFHRKGASDSFYQEVITKVQTMIDENKKAEEKQEKVRLRDLSLDRMISGTIPVIDTVFDVLRGLHGKRIDWFDIETICSILGQRLELTTQKLPPLTLEFSGLSGAVAKQDPREVVDAARGILKVIHDYFNNLNGDDVSDVHPNFGDATMLINSYYMLNDVLLGKIVGQNDNPREHRSLDRILLKLGNQTNFKVNLEELQASLNSLGAPDVDSENVIEDTREIFKEPLSQLYSAS